MRLSRLHLHRLALVVSITLVSGMAGIAFGPPAQAATAFGTVSGPFVTASSSAVPWMITAGPDGNMWFTEQSSNDIGRITPAGVITEFPISADASPWGIVTGPDGNLWFTDSSSTASAIGRITPAGVVTLFSSGLTAGSQPEGIAVGPDGDLWFTEFASSKVGKITESGVISEYSLAAARGPKSITTGPDGNLWFTEYTADRVGVIGTDGVLKNELSAGISPGSRPFGILAAADGDIWISEFASGSIAQISMSGSVSEFPLPLTTSAPESLTLAPNGKNLDR